MKKPKAPSYARLNPLAKGRIVGLREAGTRRDDIAKMAKQKDGSSPSLITVDTVLQQFEADPQWYVEDRTAGGRPRNVTTVQTAKIKKILLRDVGKFVVSATHVGTYLGRHRWVRYMNSRRTPRVITAHVAGHNQVTTRSHAGHIQVTSRSHPGHANNGEFRTPARSSFV